MEVISAHEAEKAVGQSSPGAPPDHGDTGAARPGRTRREVCVCGGGVPEGRRVRSKGPGY